MATPRHRLVDSEQPLFYHIVSRCVRCSWLCGRDRATRRDYTHRKRWLIKRLEDLTPAFPIQLFAYAIMANHFHLVLYYDPKASEHWSPEEVVRRWFQACPPRHLDGAIDTERQLLLTEQLLEQPERIEAIRLRLGSLSTFMQFLKQPIARQANLEDGCTGHFFEQRFYSGALLDQESIQAAMVYVDLNPFLAKIEKTLHECQHTSVAHRLTQEELTALLADPITPVMSGLEQQPELHLTLSSYIEHLQSIIDINDATSSRSTRWHQWMASLQRQQRVYGSKKRVKDWLAARNMQFRESTVSYA